ncbi:MAG: hypothetical protein J0J15_23070, partial [Mesorhizobium sp.]|nr:hypothetical protein [Mesorhizobium sp.]
MSIYDYENENCIRIRQHQSPSLRKTFITGIHRTRTIHERANSTPDALLPCLAGRSVNDGMSARSALRSRAQKVPEDKAPRGAVDG